MNRIYLKKTENELMTIAKKLDADYVEGTKMIFKCPKRAKKAKRIAISISKNSTYGWGIKHGVIDDSCDNFIESSTDEIGAIEELKFVLDVLSRAEKELTFKEQELID